MSDGKLQRARWVIGNWKMNPSTVWDAMVLAGALTEEAAVGCCSIGIAPSVLHFHAIKPIAERENPWIRFFAQDVSVHEGNGAYTGDVSAAMLANAGFNAVLVGHSERRLHAGDTEAIIQQKIAAVLQAGMLVVLCVGESLAEREAGHAEAVVLQQVQTQLAHVAVNDWKAGVWIAYEPVWAIGTGRTASPADAQQMHAAIRAYLRSYDTRLENTLILYGGSVKPDNAASLAGCPDVDGALVGGAALDAASFLAIAHAFAPSSPR